MTTGTKLSFGIKTAPQNTTYEGMLRVWQEADTLPIMEHAWLFDHFMPLGADPTGPCLEGWTLAEFPVRPRITTRASPSRARRWPLQLHLR